MSFFYIYLIFIILFEYSNFEIIVLPFKNSNSNDKNNFLKNFIKKDFITDIYIGTPPQIININIAPKDYRFYIGNNICFQNSSSFYNYSKSLSYEEITPGYSPFEYFVDCCYAYDKISLYNNINLTKNISIDKFQFFFAKKNKLNENSKIFCGSLGISNNVEDINDYYDENFFISSFFSSLKTGEYINKYTWTYEYFENNKYINNIINDSNILNNYEGLLIIGEYPHEYNPIKYMGYQLINIYSDKKIDKFSWSFKYNKIYYYINNDIIYNNININKEGDNIINLKDKEVELLLNIEYIISTNEFFYSIKGNFFDFYLNKIICLINIIKLERNEYKIISCKNKYFTIDEMKKFPSIYFYNKEFNYKFKLNYNELFKENNNEIYFLLYFHKYKFWKLGKLFLKKFHFSFNIDSKTIHFYSNYDEILLNKKKELTNNKNINIGLKNKNNIKIHII